MDNRNTEHLLHVFLSGVRVFRDKPFIFEKHAKMFISCLRKEAAAEINNLARALHSIGLKADSRVAFCGLKPSKDYWMCEWATLSIKATAVIIPTTFPHDERIAVLQETRSRVAVVATVAEAGELFSRIASLPDLTHIICFEGKGNIVTEPAKPKGIIPLASSLTGAKKPEPVKILDYTGFMQSGRNHPDRTADVLALIAPTDTAILFFSQKQGEIHKVVRYTFEQLMAHARLVERLMGTSHTMHETDIVLTSPSWNNAVAHITSCYLPILRDASIQINDNPDDFTSFENHPHIVVADTHYLETLRRHIETKIKNSGWLEWKLFQKALEYGKRKYESSDKIGLRRRFFDYVLNVTVIRKVTSYLGGRLRLIIGIDDAASYDTELFFHTFGVELVEISSELFTVE